MTKIKSKTAAKLWISDSHDQNKIKTTAKLWISDSAHRSGSAFILSLYSLHCSALLFTGTRGFGSFSWTRRPIEFFFNLQLLAYHKPSIVKKFKEFLSSDLVKIDRMQVTKIIQVILIGLWQTGFVHFDDLIFSRSTNNLMKHHWIKRTRSPKSMISQYGEKIADLKKNP